MTKMTMMKVKIKKVPRNIIICRKPTTNAKIVLVSFSMTIYPW